MSKVMFTNNFSKSLAALLREYNNAPIHLSGKSMAEYLNNFIENGSYICENIHNDYERLSDQAFWRDVFPEKNPFDNTPQTSKSVQYLLSIFIPLRSYKEIVIQYGEYKDLAELG